MPFALRDNLWKIQTLSTPTSSGERTSNIFSLYQPFHQTNCYSFIQAVGPKQTVHLHRAVDRQRRCCLTHKHSIHLYTFCYKYTFTSIHVLFTYTHTSVHVLFTYAHTYIHVHTPAVQYAEYNRGAWYTLQIPAGEQENAAAFLLFYRCEFVSHNDTICKLRKCARKTAVQPREIK